MRFNGFRFRDRREAGCALAAELRRMKIEAPVVVALPRGGVPVAHEVAMALGAPLDIALVRKLGAPRQPELAIGALGEDGTLIVDRDTIASLGIGSAEIESIVRREAAELERRRDLYRRGGDAVDVAGRTAIVVDDGLATGATAAAAVRVMDARDARRTIVAVPVCPAGLSRGVREQLGELVCLERRSRFGGVGAWYEDFTQIADAEVVELLRSHCT